MKRPLPLSSCSDECNKRPTEHRHSDPVVPYPSIGDFDKIDKRALVDLEIPDSVRKRVQGVTEDLLNKREAFLKARLQPMWQLPGMTKIASKFITLQIERAVESKDGKLTITENLKVICEPPRLEKLFLR